MNLPPDAPYRILVVDDDDAVRAAMLDLLAAAGYAAEGFGDGAALLAAADPGLAHCALLDIHLDEGDIHGDGFALGARLLAGAPRLPLIFITGDEDPRLDERARAAGALTLMRKPVDADCLLALIDAIPPPGAGR
jgi:FixJ family two-component response regulator